MSKLTEQSMLHWERDQALAAKARAKGRKRCKADNKLMRKDGTCWFCGGKEAK